ncbi:MAG: terminase gpP N-terminus-related DNA-binding protein [Coprococcus sp.]
MPRAPSEKVTQAEKLFNDGMAMVEIAKKLEVSDGTVRSWKNRYGWGKASKKQVQRCEKK